MDALALDPVPFEVEDFAEAASGEHQQADDGDDMRAVELVADEHGVEPGHLLRRQEPLPGLHPVAPGILARVGIVGAVSPKLGHAHHDGQGGHGAVGAAGAFGHGGEPVSDMLDGDGVHGQMAEGGEDVVADHVGAGLQGPGLPVPGVAFEELLGEGGHRVAGCLRPIVLPDWLDEGGEQLAGLRARLGHGHGIGAADGDRADAPAHAAAEEERPMPAGADAKAEAGNHVVPDIVLLGAGLGGADAPGEGRFGVVGHGSRLPVWAARPVVGIGSGRGGVCPREPRGGASRKARKLRDFLSVHAMADTDRKSINDASGVLRSPVRMMHDPFGPALSQRHVQRPEHQFGTKMGGHRPSHHPAAEHVEHDGQIHEPGPGPHDGPGPDAWCACPGAGSPRPSPTRA